MGFPKTLIDAARTPSNTTNDKGYKNGTTSSEKLEDDPEDIKVIHFGIV